MGSSKEPLHYAQKRNILTEATCAVHVHDANLSIDRINACFFLDLIFDPSAEDYFMYKLYLFYAMRIFPARILSPRSLVTVFWPGKCRPSGSTLLILDWIQSKVRVIRRYDRL